jgi:hypothetical protein
VIGRRLPVVNGEVVEWPSQPGDYVGPVMGYTGALPAVFFLKPNARDADIPPVARAIQHVVSPPHRFRECPDGSLEIRNSIGNLHNYGNGQTVDDHWHGYLDEGHHWRKV